MPCVFLERCVDARAVHLSCSVPSSVDRMDEPAPTYQPLYTSAVVVLFFLCVGIGYAIGGEGESHETEVLRRTPARRSSPTPRTRETYRERKSVAQSKLDELKKDEQAGPDEQNITKMLTPLVEETPSGVASQS